MGSERENLLGRTIMQPIDCGNVKLAVLVPVPLVQWCEGDMFYVLCEEFYFGGKGDSEEAATANFIQRVGNAWERLVMSEAPNSEPTARAVLRSRLQVHFAESAAIPEPKSAPQEASKFTASDIEDTVSGDDPDDATEEVKVREGESNEEPL